MLYRLWKFCNKIKWFNLANAIAYYNASQFVWKMLPGLTPYGLIEDKVKSFIMGYLSSQRIGWTWEIENPYIDSDPRLERWDIAVNLEPETKVIVRSRY